MEESYFIRESGSFVDVTLLFEGFFWRMRSEIENQSDHHQITFSLSGCPNGGCVAQLLQGDETHTGWNTSRIEPSFFEVALTAAEWVGDSDLPPGSLKSDDAKLQIRNLVRFV